MLQDECCTHMLLRKKESFPKTICWKLSSWAFIASPHKKDYEKLPPGDARDTCVIDKVRIWVDVFGKRERKEKSVNSSPCYSFPQFPFLQKQPENLKNRSSNLSFWVMREANFSIVWQKSESWLDCPVRCWSICVKGLARHRPLLGVKVTPDL